MELLCVSEKRLHPRAETKLDNRVGRLSQRIGAEHQACPVAHVDVSFPEAASGNAADGIAWLYPRGDRLAVGCCLECLYGIARCRT